MLCHYLDNLVAIFKVDALPERLVYKAKAYIWITNLLGFPQNDPNNYLGIVVIVFRVEIDTFLFTVWLLVHKLETVIKATLKVFTQKMLSFIDILLIVGFSFLYSQAFEIGHVFIRSL